MAKTIELEIFEFKELSPEAQQKALNKYRDNFEFYYNEANSSINVFCDLFNIKLREYDWSYKHISYRNNLGDNILNLSGKRLLSFLWNTKSKLWDRKYRKHGKEHVKEPNLRHPMITWKYINNKRDEPFYYRTYRSNIVLDTDCVLTGCCYDYWLLDPIYDLWKKPDMNITLQELIKKCMDSFIKCLSEDYESQMSDEYITEEIELNELEFLANGDVWTN